MAGHLPHQNIPTCSDEREQICHMKLVHVGFCGGVSSALADVTEVQEHKLLGLLAKLSGWAWKPPCSPLEHKPKSCSGESVYSDYLVPHSALVFPSTSDFLLSLDAPEPVF
ncbi:hypothetical protein PGT21_011740 [Puccinia graminis f. sp. tritici]|uniref:Uncharacterized protein n=1 Tax=Puccinia graminis f. sp. tritici TaxID=56615 RepID=A0A5B0Q544_PUCGR|nr:hypothetical protein PGT21_011740 [Puccinia graminis f. sp. tritici]